MKTKNDIINDLICYAANMKFCESEYNDKQIALFSEFNKEWEKLPCDNEGPNKEQEKDQNNLLENYAEQIIKAEREK